jgi:hypothetical protein
LLVVGIHRIHLELSATTVALQKSKQAVNHPRIGCIDDEPAPAPPRHQPRTYELLEMKRQGSRWNAKSSRDDAGRQSLGSAGREQAHQLQSNILRQCAQGEHGRFTPHSCPASAGRCGS